jgi:hypothetical protein
VPKTLAVALALLPSDDARRTDLARSLLTTAPPPEAPPVSLRPTLPGLGNRLRRGRRDAIPPSARFPRGQAFASSCRLVTGRQAAGGKRLGTAGQKSGNAPLPWAFSAAAPLFVRHTPQGQNLLARVEKPPDTGTALRLLAPTRGRAVYSMLTRTGAWDRERFRQTAGRSAGEPDASLAPEGMRLPPARWRCPLDGVCARHGVQRPCIPAPWRLLGPPLASEETAMGTPGGVGGPSPAPGTPWRVPCAQPGVCLGRYAGPA